jgi:hypothetical protein
MVSDEAVEVLVKELQNKLVRSVGQATCEEENLGSYVSHIDHNIDRAMNFHLA